MVKPKSRVVPSLGFLSVALLCAMFFSFVAVNTLNSKRDPKLLQKAFASAFTQKIFSFYCNQKAQAFG